MKIAVSTPSFSKNETLRRELRALFPKTIFNEKGIRLRDAALIEYINDADGAIVGLEKIDSQVLEGCKHLKIISKYGVGLDNIDLDHCIRRNIHIGWTPGVNRKSVAEMVVGFMICLVRNMFSSSFQMKGGIWDKSGGFDLNSRTVGIIGVGNIGKEVVRLLKPFGCKILVNDIVDQSKYYTENSLEECSKEDIYRNSDVVTIHTPLNSQTRHMINSQSLSLMKRNAYLINTARAGIVNTGDLKRALVKDIIAGAALDVFDEEPPRDRELLDLPNLICTPHIGGNSHESILAMGRSAIKHLKDYFKK